MKKFLVGMWGVLIGGAGVLTLYALAQTQMTVSSNGIPSRFPPLSKDAINFKSLKSADNLLTKDQWNTLSDKLNVLAENHEARLQGLNAFVEDYEKRIAELEKKINTSAATTKDCRGGPTFTDPKNMPYTTFTIGETLRNTETRRISQTQDRNQIPASEWTPATFTITVKCNDGSLELASNISATCPSWRQFDAGWYLKTCGQSCKYTPYEIDFKPKNDLLLGSRDRMECIEKEPQIVKHGAVVDMDLVDNCKKHPQPYCRCENGDMECYPSNPNQTWPRLL